MKKLMMTTAFAAILAVGAGAAGAADQTITLGASVSGFCTVDSGGGPQTVTVNTANGNTTGTTSAIASLSVTCNNSTEVKLVSDNGAMTLADAAESTLTPVSGFRNKIEYVATIGAVSLNTSPGAEGTSVQADYTTGAATTTNTVTITPETSSTLLVAGAYSDVLTVEVIPD